MLFINTQKKADIQRISAVNEGKLMCLIPVQLN